MIDASWQDQINAAANNGALPGDVRQLAASSFVEKGFPTPKLEDWKYTNLSSLVSTSFVAAADHTSGSDGADLIRKAKVAPNSIGVVAIVNGVVDWSLSSLSELPQGVRVYSLSSHSEIEDESDRARITKKLGSVTPVDQEPLAALGTACATDGVAVLLDEGVCLENPLSVVCVVSTNDLAVASYPRLLVDAAKNSSCQLIETFSGTKNSNYFTNAVSEFCLAESAKVVHYRMQNESEDAYHVSAIDARLATSSRFETFTFSFGGKLVRNDVRVALEGENSHATMNGLSVLDKAQHVDNNTVLDHAVPNCTSHEFYKGIYGQESRGVFSGTIIVRKDAQKTNAIQSNQALLLSRDAEIDSRPQLKIWADDVRCTHGATVGQLDEDQLFYLMARGIPRSTARDILIKGFAQGVVEQVESETVAELLVEELLNKLQRIPTEI